jgi:hypothetical protein
MMNAVKIVHYKFKFTIFSNSKIQCSKDAHRRLPISEILRLGQKSPKRIARYYGQALPLVWSFEDTGAVWQVFTAWLPSAVALGAGGDQDS